MASLGERIHNKRKERGLTLKQLGEIIGFSHSYISQVERNLIVPSLSALRDLATGLNISPGELLSTSADSDIKEVQVPIQIVYRNQRLSMVYPDSSVKNELLLPYYDSNFSIAWLTFPPRSENTSIKHRVRRGNLYAVVVSGILHFCSGIENYILERGDAITYKAELEHGWVNQSDEVAELILFTKIEIGL